jgi:hypothetical protein
MMEQLYITTHPLSVSHHILSLFLSQSPNPRLAIILNWDQLFTAFKQKTKEALNGAGVGRTTMATTAPTTMAATTTPQQRFLQ